MNKFLLGTAALVALGAAAPAAAADFAPSYFKAPAMVAAIYDWSGFYAGVNGGGAWNHNCWDRNTAAGVFVGSAGCQDPSGGMVGGQLGYRWQASNWLFGVEAQGDWADLKGSNISLRDATVTNQSKLDALGFLTGQMGYTWSNTLFYVKGGAAVVHDKYNGISAAFGVFDQATETRWGGVVGAGVEYAFAPNWSVAVEYDHVFMGADNLNLTSTGVLSPAGTFSRAFTIHQDLDMATARVNYRFGAPVTARY